MEQLHEPIGLAHLSPPHRGLINDSFSRVWGGRRRRKCRKTKLADIFIVRGETALEVHGGLHVL